MLICATWSELYAGLINEWINSVRLHLNFSFPYIFSKSRIVSQLSCSSAKSHISPVCSWVDKLNKDGCSLDR
jgi:hypothetical protein